MKTKAIEFGGVCSLNWCESHNDTQGRGGVEILIDSHESLADGGMGEMCCIPCAVHLAREIQKRVKECREKQASGREYCGDPCKWRKKKAAAS